MFCFYFFKTKKPVLIQISDDNNFLKKIFNPVYSLINVIMWVGKNQFTAREIPIVMLTVSAAPSISHSFVKS